MSRNDEQKRNPEHDSDAKESTFDKVVKKTSEMLSGSDEGWESKGKNDVRETTHDKFQNTSKEGTGNVSASEKTNRTPNKNANKK